MIGDPEPPRRAVIALPPQPATATPRPLGESPLPVRELVIVGVAAAAGVALGLMLKRGGRR